METNYYNAAEEQLSVIHFPGEQLNFVSEILRDNIDRDIKISENLSVISIMNKECFNNSPLQKQLEHNNIMLYNTALNVKIWNNTIKIQSILDCLDMIDTDYALILDGRDTIITSDLDDLFLTRYLSFNVPILYNATTFAHPHITIESIQELVKIKGKAKYLNAGVCIGTKNGLKEFYQKAKEVKQNFPNTSSEQLIIRYTRIQLPHLAGIDSEQRLFRAIHDMDTKIIENENGKKIVI